MVAVRVGADPKNFVGVPVPLVVRGRLVRSVGGGLVEGPVEPPVGGGFAGADVVIRGAAWCGGAGAGVCDRWAVCWSRRWRRDEKLVAVRVGADPKNFVGVPEPLVVRGRLVRFVGGVVVEGAGGVAGGGLGCGSGWCDPWGGVLVEVPVEPPVACWDGGADGVIRGRCAGRGAGVEPVPRWRRSWWSGGGWCDPWAVCWSRCRCGAGAAGRRSWWSGGGWCERWAVCWSRCGCGAGAAVEEELVERERLL